MPEPVFRSTPGHRPGAAADPAGEIDTEIPQSTAPAPVTARAADVIDATEASDLHPDAAGAVRPAPMPAPAKTRRGCAKSFLFVIFLIGLMVAVAVAAGVYYVYYYQPVDPSTF